MARAVGVLAASAATVIGIDLGLKALVTDSDVVLHARSPVYALVAVAALAWSVALLATGSRLLAAAGGLVLGGALANVASLAVWPGVPDPLVAGGIAFNPADVAALIGGLVAVPFAAGLVIAQSYAMSSRSVPSGSRK
jgi:hypothetical protein